jgi:hypothetical protein
MTDAQVAISLVVGILTLIGLLELRISHLVKRLVKDYWAELRPNGGGSVKDKVDEIHRLLLENKETK